MPIDPSTIKWDAPAPGASAPTAGQVFTLPKSPPVQTAAQAQGDELRNQATTASTAKTGVDIKGATWRPATEAEKKAYGVDVTLPAIINGNGQISVPAGLKAATPPAQEAAQKADLANDASVMLGNLEHLRGIAGHRLAVGQLPSSQYFRDIPIISQNANDVAAQLHNFTGSAISEKLKNKEYGASDLRAVQEQQNAAASVAALDQSQSFPEFNRGIDAAQNHFLRALARAKDMDPDDPSVRERLAAGAGFDVKSPAVRTRFNLDGPRPNAMQQPDAGPDPLQISTSSQHVAPTAANKAAGDKLGVMFARGMPLANMQLFAKQNGLEYLQSNLAALAAARANPNSSVAKWFKQNPGKRYPVNVGGYDRPLTGAEHVGAEVSGSAPGAFLAGIADTGSFGAIPDAAGIINHFTGRGPTREDVLRRQGLLADAHPVATTLGDLAGGLTSGLVMDAPKGLGGLMRQAALYGGAHDFLSSDDPSLAGRATNGAIGALTGAVAAPVIDLGLRGVGAGAKGLGRTVRGLMGDSEGAATSAALDKVAAKMPQQDIAASRAAAANQRSLGIEPSGASVIDRSGQDFLARTTAGSPQARTAANAALDAARAKLPAQIADDFTSAIEGAMVDPSSNGDKSVAKFLNRPAREITGDIQNAAGNEFEKAITPIYHEPVQLNDDLTRSLSSEHVADVVSSAIRQPGVTPETKQVLRALPTKLAAIKRLMSAPIDASLDPKQIETLQSYREQAAKDMLQGTGLNVEAVWRLRRALGAKAESLANGSDQKAAINEVTASLRDDLGQMYPEWADANKLYASRQRAIDALNDTRGKFLSDTDAIAAQTAKYGATRGEPMDGAQTMPSEQEMAKAGAREAVKDAAGQNARGSAETTGIDLSGANQRERNRMVLGDEGAATVESRANARTDNVDTLGRIASNATADAAGGKIAAAMRAAVKWAASFKHSAATDLARNISGLSADDAGRIVELYTTPGGADTLLDDLEKRYGQRKARFIIGRLGAIATTASANRTAQGGQK